MSATEQIVYFDNKSIGVIPNIVLRLLTKRRTTKDQIEKATLKIILASIYGILG